MVTYFKNQKDLVDSLKEVIDSYWNQSLSEAELISFLNDVFHKNKEMIIRNNTISTSITHHLGQKRMKILVQILELEDMK